MKRLHDPGALKREIAKQCKWSAVPPRVLEEICRGLQQRAGDPPSSSDGPALTTATNDDENAPAEVCQLQRHLIDSVPLEWRCESVTDLPKINATLNAQAIGTPGGVLCFGGRTSSAARLVQVEHAEQHLIRMGRLEDHSQVYQVRRRRSGPGVRDGGGDTA